MKFQLMYHTTSREYHARLYTAEGQLVMWTKSSPDKQEIIDTCWKIKREGIDTTTPIYDVVY